jgi:cytochrome P450
MSPHAEISGEMSAAIDIDPATPGFFLRTDYHEVLARLRDEAPLHEFAPGMKVVSRYHDIREISRDPERFCSSRGALINDPLRAGGSIEGSILHMDPPRHAEWRRLLNRAFTPRAVAGMEPQIRERAVHLLEAIPRGEVVDLVDLLTAPLPVLVIADLLGVADGDRADFRRWSDATISASDGTAELSAEELREVTELVSFLDAHARAKAATPGDDLVSLLVGAEVEGRSLTPGELVTFTMSLLVAGNETTRHLLSGGLIALADNPDQRAALAGDRSALPAAVEECLRWTTPIQQFARTATADTRLGDSDVSEGDYLVMLYASGNRDETVFGPTASVFDAARIAPAPNLAFGFGEHLCLGAALARLEARVVLDELLDRYATYEIAGPVEWLASSLVCGPERVPAVL